MNHRQKKKLEKQERLVIKDFFDRILPGNLKFYSDHYVCGDSYRCVWAVREYPPVPPLYGMDDSSIGVISTSGVYGDATLASAEKGEAMMEEFARRTAALIGVALAGAQG